MALPLKEKRNRAHQFIKKYANAFKENAESQSFLNDFFHIFGVERYRVAVFEQAVKTDADGGTKRIDLFWPGHLLVEMKSAGQDLEKAFQQAYNYVLGLKEDLPRYVMVCDLNTFRIKDLEHKDEEHKFDLEELIDNFDVLSFMEGKEIQGFDEQELNEAAALLLGELHDSLEASGYKGHQLQVFMMRILFCIFAEDTGIFEPHQFIRYLKKFTHESGFDTDLHINKLFQVLDKPYPERNLNLPEEQAAFPYVNGHLFKERLDMPTFDAAIREKLIECCYFNWQDISPAIFGSLFQSIMDKTLRRNLGAHYTSEANILKVIEPLFLDELKAELASIKLLKQTRLRNERLANFINKIRNLKFLDPACGCGNFLIIAYRELRRLELEVLEIQRGEATGSKELGLEIQPAIPLNNFYGIEIDEWPARIAEVAMWLTQHQMNLEFAKTFGKEPDLLPLKDHAEITHANALEIDWAEVVQPSQLNYIIGNPPFVGKNFRTKEQEASQQQVFMPQVKSWKSLDFVTSWFYKAALFAQDTAIEIGLVSTNSITMGEQVGILWQPILDMGFHINFAHRTFEWSNDAAGKATVSCVIIGLACFAKEAKAIFDYPSVQSEPNKIRVENINPYLIDAPNLVIGSRSKPLNLITTPMVYGSKPVDGGFLFLEPDTKAYLLAKYPQLKNWIKPAIGAQEFINNGKRYCLWFADASTRELRELMKLPEIAERIEGVKQMRLASAKKKTQMAAEIPWLFDEIRHPKKGAYILVPSVSTSRRHYVPMGFFTSQTVSTNLNLMIPNASLYDFGVLTSELHMDWMRVVAGRLGNGYRYSAQIVYNNFPFPNTDKKQQAAIEKLAQKILDAREEEFAKDPATSLADLYDPDLMPQKLRKAHRDLDKAVDKLYQPKGFKTPLERVKHLFQLYQQQTA